jgi:hypothetical protein
LLEEEEMWRVQVSFLWGIDVWKRRAGDMRSHTDGNQDGQAMYVLHQVDVRESMLAHCGDVWVKAYRLLCSDVDAAPPPQGN